MAELGRKEAERLIKEILTEYAKKIRTAKRKEYTADVQPLFSPDINAFYKLVKSEDMDFYIFNRLNDEGIRHLLNDSCRLAKCYELDSYGKIKDFTYKPESPKCRIASDSGGKYTAGGSYTFTLEGKAELGNKWYEPYRVVWHFYRENPGTGKYEETASKMDEARALADFDTWDRSFLVSEKGRYKVTATIFNQAITTGIRPDIVEVCELYFEAEERNIAALSCSDKIRIAMEYSNVIDEIREEIGDINILVTQMVIVSSFLIGLALTGYGAVAEALGFVLLAAGAAMSGTQLLAGVIELVKFFTTVDDAKTEDDLKVCGKIFGDAVAKIGVDGLFFFLSMFGLKKASARLTTRTVIDNGLNSKKWSGKQIVDKNLQIIRKYAKGYDTHMIVGKIGKGQKGVVGAHNRTVFIKTLTDAGFDANKCIISETKHSIFRGLSEIDYQLPAKTQQGQYSGLWKHIPHPKTVYDSSIYSDMQILEWGKEAMQNSVSVGNNVRTITGTAKNGMRFQGYIDTTTGEITNFHPIF